MHSIRTRIASLTIAAILVSVSSVGWISLVSIRRAGEKNSTEKMTLICENSRNAIDDYLDSIEQAVDMVSDYATDRLNNIEMMEGGGIGFKGLGTEPPEGCRTAEQQERLDAYLSGHIREVEQLFRCVADNTNGVIAFYYRVNPELTDDEMGFFYAKQDRRSFTAAPLTDLGAYDRSDIGHVGWYYIPLARGWASWIDPYYNENLGIRMFSYATPIYNAGSFVGVIGMDISYDTLIEQISSIKIYDTGYAFLMKKNGSVVYHPMLEEGDNIVDLDPSLRKNVSQFAVYRSNSEPIRYQIDGEERQMFFDTLSSGLKLAVTAPVREITRDWLTLIRRIMRATLLILAIFITAAAFLMRRMTEPLKRLTEASQDIAAGNYEISLDYKGRDEVGILTNSFQQLVEHLRVYISDLNSKAYRDAMTGVRNKGAYEIFERKLNDAIGIAEERSEFGIVMLDCNNLKKINDTYGHEKGDAYLRTACSVICGVFHHSPVFRMGGDEFVVVLQGEDYESRGELLRTFDALSAEINESAKEPWEAVSIAKGLAVYDPGLDADAGSVFRRADEEMYENKKRSKLARK